MPATLKPAWSCVIRVLGSRRRISPTFLSASIVLIPLAQKQLVALALAWLSQIGWCMLTMAQFWWRASRVRVRLLRSCCLWHPKSLLYNGNELLYPYDDRAHISFATCIIGCFYQYARQ